MKRVTSILLACLLFALLALPAASAADFTARADELKALGLFMGSAKGYELDRAPNRAEAATLLVRMLGKEAEAKAQNNKHPFTDVPDWASANVGYLYQNGMAKGVSNTRFDARGLCDIKMFCAFTLRALGYTEAAGDFTYADAADFAATLGLVDDTLSSGDFLRGDAVAIMYNALLTNRKGSDVTLLDSLAAGGAVPAAAAKPMQDKGAFLKGLADALNAAPYSKADALSVTLVTEMKMPVDIEGTGQYVYVDYTKKITLKAIKRNDQYSFEFIQTVSMMGYSNTISAYLRDGYLYFSDGIEKEKIKADDPKGEYDTTLALTGLAEGEGSAQFNACLIDSITKTETSSGTAFTLGVPGDFLNDLLQELTEGGSDLTVGKATYSFFFTPGGDLETCMTSVPVRLRDPGTGTNTEITVKSTLTINAYGSGVSISFPSFSGYIEG